jgi:hypothetical protein
MLIAGGGENGKDVIDNLPLVEPEFEMVQAALNWETSIATLKEIANLFNLSGGAQKKEILFNLIHDFPHVTKISTTKVE